MAISSGVLARAAGRRSRFKAGTSMSVVCAHCKHVVMRTDRDLVNLGKVADVVFNDTALAHNDHGVFQKRSYIVEGRIVMQHPAGGTWEEYYALFDGRYAGWIEEAMGVWYVLQQVAAPGPPLAQCEPGALITLGPYGAFVVGERSEGTFLSAEGELPFAVAPGTTRRFVDLSAADGARASLHYGEGEAAPDVFVGVQTNFASLGVYSRSGERAAHDVRTQEILCPSCGAPVPSARRRPARSAWRCTSTAMRLSDLATHRVLSQQAAERQGSPSASRSAARGCSEGISEWTVIGFVTSAASFVEAGEEFRWEEFLLYNESDGYRLAHRRRGDVELLGAPIQAGDVDTTRFPSAVKSKDRLYKLGEPGDPARGRLRPWASSTGAWRSARRSSRSATSRSVGASSSRARRRTPEINWTLSKPGFEPSTHRGRVFGLDRRASSRPRSRPRRTGSGQEVFCGRQLAVDHLARGLMYFGGITVFPPLPHAAQEVQPRG